jgi:hypothetical protein
LKNEALDFIEFLIHKNENLKIPNHPKSGFLKGSFSVQNDFDEPLDDFKEYM